MMNFPKMMNSPKTKKKGEKDPSKRKEMITVNMKKEIIRKHEGGMRVVDLARLYNKSSSTICTILKKKQEIMELQVAKGVTKVTKQRPKVLEDLENLLLVWINEKQLSGDIVTENLICKKARDMYAELVNKQPGSSTQPQEDFKASRGWFDNFKKRSGIRGLLKQKETATDDIKVAEAFAAEFHNHMVEECYLPQQVFNCDETGLYWKKMPKRTYIAVEENAASGYTPVKDRLSLLLCANASGDFKVKPLLVYHSENPRAFRKCKVQKDQLNVMWKSNNKAWVTPIFFVEWINYVFGPAVKKYLMEMNLPLKVLLVLDNSPAHPRDIEDKILAEYDFIKVMFLPPSTSALIQPMDQCVITNFKKLYTKSLFEKCFEMTERTHLTLGEYWEDHFHIVSCVRAIDKAWNDVTKKILNFAWRKLWPACVEEFVHEYEEDLLMEQIVTLGRTLGLEVSKEDIQELVEGQDLSIDELYINPEQQIKQGVFSEIPEIKEEVFPEVPEIKEEVFSEEEEKLDAETSLSSDEIREVCKMWEIVQNFVENHHPNKFLAMRAITMFNDCAMSYFREILKMRQRQMLDGLLVNIKKEKDSEPEDICDPLMTVEVVLQNN